MSEWNYNTYDEFNRRVEVVPDIPARQNKGKRAKFGEGFFEDAHFVDLFIVDLVEGLLGYSGPSRTFRRVLRSCSKCVGEFQAGVKPGRHVSNARDERQTGVKNYR